MPIKFRNCAWDDSGWHIHFHKTMLSHRLAQCYLNNWVPAPYYVMKDLKHNYKMFTTPQPIFCNVSLWGTTALVYWQLNSSLYTGAVQDYWSTPNWSDCRQGCRQMSTNCRFKIEVDDVLNQFCFQVWLTHDNYGITTVGLEIHLTNSSI